MNCLNPGSGYFDECECIFAKRECLKPYRPCHDSTGTESWDSAVIEETSDRGTHTQLGDSGCVAMESSARQSKNIVLIPVPVL